MNPAGRRPVPTRVLAAEGEVVNEASQSDEPTEACSVSLMSHFTELSGPGRSVPSLGGLATC